MMTLFARASVLALAVALAGCGGSSAPASAIATPTLVPVGGSLEKTPLAGLIDMQDISWHNTDAGQPAFVIGNVDMFPGLFGGIVINATWSQMQPAAGGSVDFSDVDAALSEIRAYNAANPGSPLGVKLRIYGGNSAPSWAKSLSGGPVTIYRNPAGCDGAVDSCPLTIGLFWTAPYITAWRAFQAQVAAKYDSEPLVRAVAVTSCASQTDEPFVPTTGPVSKSNLGNAAVPYSDAAEQACLSGAVNDYSAWPLTAIDFTFNTYTKFTGGTDAAFTESVMMLCRSTVGSRCVLDNHALSSPVYSGDSAIYAAIAADGPPINFQTEAPEGMGCLWRATIAQGVALGANAIEVWPETKYQGFDTLTVAQVKKLAKEFTTPIPVPKQTPLPTPCTGFH